MARFTVPKSSDDSDFDLCLWNVCLQNMRIYTKAVLGIRGKVNNLILKVLHNSL